MPKKIRATIRNKGLVDLPAHARGERRRKNIQYLPSGEIIFRKYYTEMGTARSQKKVRAWLVSEGYTNPTTGKPPAVMAPWFKMWRWALGNKNFDQAYEVFNTAMADEGKYMTREQFKKFLDDKALTVFSYFPRDYTAYINGKF